MKFNVERKKASVEAMLKTAMQSQLDGVKTGLTKLEEAMRDVQEVRQCLLEMERELEELPPLLDDLDDVRAESLKHSQLATAKENLRHIFTVPETVAAAEVQITEGRLLEAHKVCIEALAEAAEAPICPS
jgi:exocyst complex component 3